MGDREDKLIFGLYIAILLVTTLGVIFMPWRCV